jgi:hypothetical protein
VEGVRRHRETVLMSANRGCEGPQPSRSLPIIVATNGCQPRASIEEDFFRRLEYIEDDSFQRV